jgi:hypothetical protein
VAVVSFLSLFDSHNCSLYCITQRVRRSELTTTPDYDDAQEMTCTMRNWEARKSPRPSSFTMKNSVSTSSLPVVGTILEGDSHCGPELLLTPLHDLQGNREGSNSPRRRWKTQGRQVHPVNEAEEKKDYRAKCSSYSVPINDIVVVETCTARKGASAHRIQITTLSLGYFDFDCISRNGHDIVLAFLQACVPVERILDGRITDDVPGIRLTSSTTSCFDNDMDLDVDALTAQHLKGQADRETWMEKMSRRTGKVVSSLSEISETFCETIVCCQVDRVDENDARESPPRPSHSFGKQSHLELDEGSQMYSPALQSEEEEEAAADKFFEKKRQSKLMLRNCHLPSGLSVEVDPASVRSVRSYE